MGNKVKLSIEIEVDNVYDNAIVMKNIENLLKYWQYCGSIGHSADVVCDKHQILIDGDGAFKPTVETILHIE